MFIAHTNQGPMEVEKTMDKNIRKKPASNFVGDTNQNLEISAS